MSRTSRLFMTLAALGTPPMSALVEDVERYLLPRLGLSRQSSEPG